MRRLALILVALGVTACARLSIGTSREPKPNPAIEALYARGLAHLDPANANGSLDSATALLDAYLAYTGVIERRPEAEAMLSLALTALQLFRVEAALQRERAETDTVVQVREGPRTRDGAALREIQRLKDELSKANAELERIRKRLADPKPPRR